MSEADIDRVAAAIMDTVTAPNFRAVWADQPEDVKTHWRFAARAAIGAMPVPAAGPQEPVAWLAEKEQLMQQIVSLRNYIGRLEKAALSPVSRPQQNNPGEDK